MHLNSQVIEEMQWWHDEMHQWSGKAIISARCPMVVMTDASSFGWGGWCSPLLAKAKEGGHPMSKERAETHVSHVSCTLLLARIHI